jgi:hypothetical protein
MQHMEKTSVPGSEYQDSTSSYVTSTCFLTYSPLTAILPYIIMLHNLFISDIVIKLCLFTKNKDLMTHGIQEADDILTANKVRRLSNITATSK